MAKQPISAAVEAFVAGSIESAEELEVLLLLYQNRHRGWTEPEVNARIQSSEPSILRRLGLLVAKGLASASGNPPAYRYAPATPQLDRAVGELAAVYKDYRPRLIQLIFQKPSDQVLGFARAFQIKKSP